MIRFALITALPNIKANFDHAIVQSRLTNLEWFPGIGFTGRVNDVGVVVITALPAEADYEPLLANIRGMSDVSGFVVDLRKHSGGSEPRAAEIAGLFTDQPLRYASAKVRGADGEMHESSRQFLSPSAAPAKKAPVICLVGPGCVSSGEGFALMMKSMPQVKLVGQPTRGASGNPQPVTLSNGVRVWFSRWISLELDGTAIEGRGVTPGTTIEHEIGSDRTFDHALDLLSHR